MPMSCAICNGDKNRGEILRLKNGTIFVCGDCQSYSMLDTVRIQGGFTVVPVKSSSLQRALRELTYIRPWRRKAMHNVFLAFYYEESVSYVGKVEHVKPKVGRDQVSHLLPSNAAWGRKEFYTIYCLEYLDELKNPIPRGGCSPVQSKLTVPFKKFVRAKTVCDLR